jgi:hypothetical protein
VKIHPSELLENKEHSQNNIPVRIGTSKNTLQMGQILPYLVKEKMDSISQDFLKYM